MIAGPKGAGPGERFCVVRDPAGAVVALWEQPRGGIGLSGGGGNVMPGFELNERIDRPPEDVFRLLTDPERVPTWLPEVLSLEPLTDGPVAAGSRFRETRRVMGKEAEAELVIAAYEPPGRYAVRNVTSGVETTYDYSLRSDGGGTAVRLVCEIRAHGLRRLSALLLGQVLRRQDRDHLAKLKTAAEGPLPDGRHAAR